MQGSCSPRSTVVERGGLTLRAVLLGSKWEFEPELKEEKPRKPNKGHKHDRQKPARCGGLGVVVWGAHCALRGGRVLGLQMSVSCRPNEL